MLKKIAIIIISTIITSLNFFVHGENDIIISEYNEANNANDTSFKIFDSNLSFGDGTPVSGINLPRLDIEGFEGDEPIVLIKSLINKIIELLPFVIFIMLLFGCFHMIVSIKDGEGKKGMKIIKQITMGVIIFILGIFVLNILSIYLSGSPVININNTFHTNMLGDNYGL